MKRFSNILFIAGSENNDKAPFKQAMELAENNQAQLTVVGLVENLKLPANRNSARAIDMQNAFLEQRQEQLRELTEGATKTGVDVEVKVLVGRASLEIIREVVSHHRDLVITTIHPPHGIWQEFFSATEKKLLRQCPCPVWLIQSTQQEGYKEILVALAYEPDNLENDALNSHILELSTSLAIADFSALHILHAWHLPHESFYRSRRSGFAKAEVDKLVQNEAKTRKAWLTDLVDTCCSKLGKEAADYLKPQLHLVEGDPRRVVPERATELGAELIVMGTVGRTGIPGFVIGNTAETILNEVKCSVLAVKPTGFVSPVTAD